MIARIDRGPRREVIARIDRTRALLVITHRPEWLLPATAHGHVSALHLNRLGKAQSAKIVRSILQDDVPVTLVQSIVSRADGIPLNEETLAGVADTAARLGVEPGLAARPG